MTDDPTPREALTRREPLDVERLARALEAQMYSYPPPYTDREKQRNARDFVLLAENVAAEYARLEAADKP